MKDNYYFTWTRQDAAPRFDVDGADGARLFLADGRAVLDMISTNFQAAFGHSDRRIIEAVEAQLRSLPIASPKAVFDLKTVQTERLLRFLKLAHRGGKIFYTLSGAEAIENALKMARQVTGRQYILARAKSYHGATLGALSVTGDWRGQGHFSVSDRTLRIPEPADDPDLKKTRRLIEEFGPEKIAAFCLETISGMNGVIIPEKSWWAGIQKLAREFKVMMIIDEVSVGFCRTGDNFAFQAYGIRPDFVCMAKAITGGYIPFGALWTGKAIADYYDGHVLNSGLTSYAHPLGLAAMKAVLDHFEDRRFVKAMSALETVFGEELAATKRLGSVAEIRSRGLLAAVFLKGGRKLSWKEGLEAGLHLAVKENMVILAPPYVMTDGALRDGFRRLRGLIK